MADRIEIHNGVLRTLLSDRGGGIATGLLRYGIAVQTQARRNCPVDTGRLRSSIGVALSIGSRGPQVTVGTSTIYARYVHDGTRYMAARPFLTDALNSVLR